MSAIRQSAPPSARGRLPALLLLALLAASFAAGCAKRYVVPPPGGPRGRCYQALGRTYWTLDTADGYEEEGLASWYGEDFHGRRTSSGEVYDMNSLTAAHKTLPLHTWVRVCNLDNRREVVVRVNDRGPFVDGRIIDLSLAGARELGMEGCGLAPVRVQALGFRTAEGGYWRPPSYDAGEFTIQVGAFRDPANAKRLRDSLNGLGEARVCLLEQEGKSFYRVRVARYRSLAEALRGQEEMRRQGFTGAFVVAADEAR